MERTAVCLFPLSKKTVSIVLLSFVNMSLGFFRGVEEV